MSFYGETTPDEVKNAKVSESWKLLDPLAGLLMGVRVFTFSPQTRQMDRRYRLCWRSLKNCMAPSGLQPWCQSAPSPCIQVWNLLNSFSRSLEAKEQKQDWFLRLNPNGTTHHALYHRFFPNIFWLVSNQGGSQLSSIITKPHRVQSSKQVPLWSTSTPPTIKTSYLASRTRWSISSLCNGYSFGMVVVQCYNSGFSLRAVPRRRFHVRILPTQLL